MLEEKKKGKKREMNEKNLKKVSLQTTLPLCSIIDTNFVWTLVYYS